MINWGNFPNEKSSLSCKAFSKDSCNMAMIKRWWKARDEWRITLKRLIAITINLSSLYFWTGIDFLLLWVGWRAFCEMDRLNLNQCLQSFVVFGNALPRFEHRIHKKTKFTTSENILFMARVVHFARKDPPALEFYVECVWHYSSVSKPTSFKQHIRKILRKGNRFFRVPSIIDLRASNDLWKESHRD